MTDLSSIESPEVVEPTPHSVSLLSLLSPEQRLLLEGFSAEKVDAPTKQPKPVQSSVQPKESLKQREWAKNLPLCQVLLEERNRRPQILGSDEEERRLRFWLDRHKSDPQIAEWVASADQVVEDFRSNSEKTVRIRYTLSDKWEHDDAYYSLLVDQFEQFNLNWKTPFATHVVRCDGYVLISLVGVTLSELEESASWSSFKRGLEHWKWRSHWYFISREQYLEAASTRAEFSPIRPAAKWSDLKRAE